MSTEQFVIAGKYKVLTELGEGGMSRVWLAHDMRLNKQWAVKELKTTGDRERDEIIAQSFIKEANIMKQLDHPFLPRIVDIVNEQDSVYVVMDYIEGRSLAKILDEYGPQPQQSVIDWSLDLCVALDYLHTRTPPIIYRDMKPANVMLRPDGTVRIIDFGIAREYKEVAPGARIDDTTVLGTRGYAAPEQFGGIGQSDARTDIYCLGATLYHLLTGLSPADPPYEMHPIRQVDPTLSPGLEKIVSKCVQQNPAARYQTCAELHYALENYEKADDAHFVKQKRKLRTFIVTLALSFVFALGGAGSLIADNIITQNSYEGRIEAGDRVQGDSRAPYYIEAINLIPDRPQAYLKLIDLYKEDGILDARENDQLTLLLEKNRSRLKANSEYPAFALEVGKLYWYYGSEGPEDSRFMRSSRAKGWFADASATNDEALKRVAQVYYQLTVFDTELPIRIAEGEEDGIYRAYFDNLLELGVLLESEPNKIVRLKAASVTFVTIETYARWFKDDGVSKAELMTLYNNTVAILDGIVFNVDVSRDLYYQKVEVESRKGQVRQAIEDAFWVKAGTR